MEKRFGENEKKRIQESRNLVIRYGGYDNYKGWKILDNYIEEILSCIDLCYKNNDICNYVLFQKQITQYLIVRGCTEADIEFEKQMIDLENKYPSNEDLLWALAHRVLRMVYQGRLVDAMKTILILEEDFSRIGDIAGLAHMLRNRGEIEEYQGNYSEAEKYYYLSLFEIYKLPNNRDTDNPFKNKYDRRLVTLTKIAITRRMQRDLIGAEKCLKYVLQKWNEKFKNETEIDNVLLYEIANLEFAKNNLWQAKRIYLRSLEKPDRQKYYRYIALAKLGLGRTYLFLNEPIRAEDRLSKSIKTFDKIDDKKNLNEAKILLNEVNRLLNKI